MPGEFTVGVFLFLLIGLSAIYPNKVFAGLADHVVINEVSIGGAASAGGTYDDWVELYNPTNQTISLASSSLQKATAAGTITTSAKVVLSGSIKAKGYLLIVRDSATTTQSLKDKANLLDRSLDLSTNNTIFLVNVESNITGSSAPGVVDYVGWGTVLYHEGASSTPSFTAGKSIARVPDGEDTDQNFDDFKAGTPTPTNSSASDGDDNLGGTVLLTITPDAEPAQNINSTGAEIVFQVNATGTALIKYGLNTGYASSTLSEAITANLTETISLTGLACATTYHYAIYAENSGATENDTTGDAVFTTLPCGIALDSLAMTESSAKANNQYDSGWQWEFNITVWNMGETSLKMKFNEWAGASSLGAGANMQYSVDADNDAAWHDITADATYPAIGADISGIDNGAATGRQVKIIVRMKVPVGTAAGYYSSSYGILTE